MPKAIAIYTGEIPLATPQPVQVAIREDGRTFRRYMLETYWGARWSRWEPVAQPIKPNGRKLRLRPDAVGFAPVPRVGVLERVKLAVRLPAGD